MFRRNRNDSGEEDSLGIEATEHVLSMRRTVSGRPGTLIFHKVRSEIFSHSGDDDGSLRECRESKPTIPRVARKGWRPAPKEKHFYVSKEQKWFG